MYFYGDMWDTVSLVRIKEAWFVGMEYVGYGWHEENQGKMVCWYVDLWDMVSMIRTREEWLVGMGSVGYG